MSASAAADAAMLEKVISGGQTGADMAGLRAARDLGIPTGGTAAPGFMTCHGSSPMLASTFGLHAMQPVPGGLAAGYVFRSMANVDDADATIAFHLKASPGTDKTISYCATGRWGIHGDGTKCAGESHRPCLTITDVSAENMDQAVKNIVSFVRENKFSIINVAGHRSVSSGCVGYENAVYDILHIAFESIQK